MPIVNQIYMVLRTEMEPTAKRGRILLIDDEVELANLYGQVLSRDHDVVIENDGRKALQLLNTDRAFDVIFLDLMMPGLNGMEIYTELERLDYALATKTVFMTAGVFKQEAQKFLKNYPNKYIEKPVETKILRALAREMVSGKGKPNYGT